MNPFTKKLNIQKYISDGGDLNIINPKTNQSFIEYILTWIAHSPSSSADRHALFELLCNPVVKTDHLHVQHLLYKCLPFFINGNFFQPYTESNNSKLAINNTLTKDELDERYKTFVLRLDLLLQYALGHNVVAHAFSDPEDQLNFYGLLQKHHPQFNASLKNITDKGENIWFHLALSTQDISILQPYMSVLNELNPEGKYLKNNQGKTIVDVLELKITLLSKPKDIYLKDEILQFQNTKSIIEYFILNETLQKTLDHKIETKKHKL